MKNLYPSIRILLSPKNRGRLSYFIIKTGLKPSVNKKANSPFDKGIVVFSADFEMAWAFRFSKTISAKAIDKGLEERKNLPVLLTLFEKYNIPVTWATVGHLFLNSCLKNEVGLPHPNMPRPAYFENKNWRFNEGDWYMHDPCTNFKTDPAWYASDLIDKILSSPVGHEIGCHTFSHTDFTYRNCPKSLADAELDACIKLAEEKGIKLKSMVFPGGTLGNFETLKEKGIICYRKPGKYHIDIPHIDKYGLVAIPSSLGLDKDPYGWPKEFHLKMIRNYLEKTAKYKMVCHFWFHPSMDQWYLENVMPEILKMVAEYENSSEIQVKTMYDLAKIYI
ncbi:MAG: hypothetical protein PWQ73_150 [Petrotoga sp.]|jgi:peptidoglycan/xylan/chitin deacetylase (PgdA/CDA1 family)|nr:hypothetical protein [Petrotoga sp.]